MKNIGINIEIIAVGSELLLGQIINTNASYLARKLAALGINLFHQSVVGDNPQRLSEALQNALRRADIVITSGGLGPTVDDITISAIAEAVSRPLVLDKTILKDIEGHFKKRGIKMPADNKRQAYIPKGAIAVKNPVGTAPASIIEYSGKTIIALPGPPRELIPIFESAIIPYLNKRYKTESVIFTRTIRTTGSPESAVNRTVKKFLMMDGPVKVGIYASLGKVDIKITAKSKNTKLALSNIKKVEGQIVRLLGDIVYGFDDESLESAVGKLLLKKNLTVATAESCTGGLIANRITNIPGSSKYFHEGAITYGNESKLRELGIPRDLIRKYGAVSRFVAIAMARGMKEKSGSDFALAVTGIAGPSGGTNVKPVGLVYIALASRRKTVCLEQRFLGNRLDIKLQASTAALDMLHKSLLT
mgnify:CR=1 FL=1